VILVRKLKFDGWVKSSWQGDVVRSADVSADEWCVVLHNPHKHTKTLPDSQTADSDGLWFLRCFMIGKPLAVLLEYDSAGYFRGAKCDASLPAVIDPEKIDFVDLDLDLIVEPDFSCRERDRATFARNRQAMGYSVEVEESAHRGLEISRSLVQARRFPFDGSAGGIIAEADVVGPSP
jgi:protein associated with RNAse G/E